jgi:hypothetical protein
MLSPFNFETSMHARIQYILVHILTGLSKGLCRVGISVHTSMQ